VGQFFKTNKQKGQCVTCAVLVELVQTIGCSKEVARTPRGRADDFKGEILGETECIDLKVVGRVQGDLGLVEDGACPTPRSNKQKKKKRSTTYGIRLDLLGDDAAAFAARPEGTRSPSSLNIDAKAALSRWVPLRVARPEKGKCSAVSTEASCGLAGMRASAGARRWLNPRRDLRPYVRPFDFDAGEDKPSSAKPDDEGADWSALDAWWIVETGD